MDPAFAFAEAKAGSSIAANRAITAITTSSSTKVNARADAGEGLMKRR